MDITVLGFDFGTKRMGVAVGYSLTNTAKPLQSISVVNGEPNWQTLKTLLEHWHPHELLVGIPLRSDGGEQHTTHLARRFVNQLKTHFTLPVHGVDERLTTKLARQLIFEQGGYKALKKTDIDSFAAKLIIEHWFLARKRVDQDKKA